jgi:hypothetical protein
VRLQGPGHDHVAVNDHDDSGRIQQIGECFEKGRLSRDVSGDFKKRAMGSQLVPLGRREPTVATDEFVGMAGQSQGVQQRHGTREIAGIAHGIEGRSIGFQSNVYVLLSSGVLTRDSGPGVVFSAITYSFEGNP